MVVVVVTAAVIVMEMVLGDILNRHVLLGKHHIDDPPLHKDAVLYL
jgi:hypothetical protein